MRTSSSIVARLRYPTAASMAVLICALAQTTLAQTPGGAPTGPSAASSGGTSSSTTVADVIVTAQKREQNLQNVPISVTVVGAQLLQDTGVRDIKDLQNVTPGLLVTSSSSEVATTARIRGVGTVGDNPGLESSVGIVVDGVYRPRNGVGFGDIGELTRVEVLKGPQGTLFGKNTSAGVINILTAHPSFKFGANAEFTAGNYGEIGGSAAVTGPLIADKLAGSLFFAQRERDGFYDVATGQGPRTRTDDQTRNFYTMRGQLLYTPTSDLTARLILDYTRRSEDCCEAVQYINGPLTPLINALAGGAGIANPPNPYNRLAYANRGDGQAIQDGGASLELNYAPAWLGGAKLTSITAYRDWRYRYGQDSDFTTLDLLYRPQNHDSNEEFKQFSEEFRIGGSVGNKLDYTGGVFVANEKLNARAQLYFGNNFPVYLANVLSAATINPATGKPAVPVAALQPIANLDAPGTGPDDNYNQNDTTYAFFGNATYHFTDKLELTGGIRYTNDDKTLDVHYTNTDGGAACAVAAARLPAALAGLTNVICQPIFNPNYNGKQNHQEHAEDAVSGTAKLDYRFSPQYLAYFSYARGYKSGGFDLDRVANPFIPAGAPNAAVSLQPVFNTSFPGEFVDSYELGLKTTLLNRKLLLNGAFFNSEFTNFQLSAFNGLVFDILPIPAVTSTGADFDFLYRPLPGLTFQGGLTYANTRYRIQDATVLSAAAATARLPGNRLNHAPLYSLTAEATYEHALYQDFMGRANVGVRFSSDYNTGSDLDPVKVQDAFALVDARVGVGPRDKRWSVELWAENLFDTRYVQTIFNATFQTGAYDAFLGQPRTFGVTLRAKY